MISTLLLAFTWALPAVFGGLVVWAFYRNRAAGNPSAVRVNPGQFVKLIEGVLAANKPMVIEALRKSFELDLTTGSTEAAIAEWALFQAQQRVNDPSRPAPVIEALAKFNGLTEAEVLAIIREDFTPKPAPTPITPAFPAVTTTVAAIFLALLMMPGSAQASYPQGPQEFRPTRPLGLTCDPPAARDQYGRLVECRPIGYCIGVSVGDGPTHYAPPVYYCSSNQPVAFMRRGPVRRGFVGAARIVSAPFRFVFRRRR